jgi:nucleotide-binding universal stress UspA family protein
MSNNSVENSITPFPPRKIMVCVDGSENSQRAATTAILIAKSYGAKLLLSHIMPMPTLIMTSPIGVGPTLDYDDYFGNQESEARNWLDPIAVEAKMDGVEVQRDIVRNAGSIVETIINRASAEHVDLIVIGTRGLGGFKRLMLGSVSTGVVTHSLCNVLVVR